MRDVPCVPTAKRLLLYEGPQSVTGRRSGGSQTLCRALRAAPGGGGGGGGIGGGGQEGS